MEVWGPSAFNSSSLEEASGVRWTEGELVDRGRGRWEGQVRQSSDASPYKALETAVGAQTGPQVAGTAPPHMVFNDIHDI